MRPLNPHAVLCSFCKQYRATRDSYYVAATDSPDTLIAAGGGRTDAICCSACYAKILYWEDAIQYGFNYNKPQPTYLDDVMEKYINHWPLPKNKKLELAEALVEVQPVCSTCQQEIPFQYAPAMRHADLLTPPPHQCETCASALNRLVAS